MASGPPDFELDLSPLETVLAREGAGSSSLSQLSSLNELVSCASQCVIWGKRASVALCDWNKRGALAGRVAWGRR